MHGLWFNVCGSYSCNWHTLWRIWCCKLRKQCKLRMADSSPKRSSNHPHLRPVCHSERCGHCGCIPMRRHKLSDTTGACQAGWVIFNHSKRDFREGLYEGCVHVRRECHVRRVHCFVDLSECYQGFFTCMDISVNREINYHAWMCVEMYHGFIKQLNCTHIMHTFHVDAYFYLSTKI